MKMNERMKKGLSLLLCVLMLVQYVPVTAFAAAEDNLCEHHTAHTAECGYNAGAACNHEHGEACGYVAAVEEVPCACTATDENGAKVHTEGCGYVAPMAGVDCIHVHDSTCSFIPASLCDYDCEICKVQALVDALPDGVTAENGVAVRAQLAAIDTAAAELSEEEWAEVDFTKYNAVYEPANVKYDITVNAGDENISVVAEGNPTAVGETVTLKFEAVDNYKIVIQVTQGETDIPVTDNGGGYFTFTMPAGDVIVTASAEIDWYAAGYHKITYVLDGGTINEDYEIWYIPVVGYKLPSDVTRTGYTFDGWYYEDGTDPIGNIEGDESGGGDVTVYARWTECPHTDNTNVYTNNQDGTHSLLCSVCSLALEGPTEHTEDQTYTLVDGTQHAVGYSCCTGTVTENHTEGTPATCTTQAVCSVCQNQYGDALGHSWVNSKCENCGETCEDHNWVNGACSTCGLIGGTCGNNAIWTFDADTGTLTIFGTGAMADYYTVSGVPWGSYRNQIKTVTIASGVTSIGNNAFNGCSALESISIPDSVTTISNYAFYDCSALTSITIPDSVTTIGMYAFDSCTSLTSVAIPNGVTTIGVYAFNNCTALTEVTIPDSVTTIGNNAFGGCTALTSIVIPEGVTGIGDGAFGGCTALTSIVIPDRVTSIGKGAFNGCSALTSVTIPNSVTTIGEYAFDGCSSLTTVNVPCTWNESPLYTFENTVTLNKVHIGTATYTNYSDTQHTVTYTCCGEATENHTYDFTNGTCSLCNATFVAGVGEVLYTTFDDALNAWTNGTTLKLYADVTGKMITISGKSVTLDLNGHTYADSYRLFTINSGAALTVTDSSAERDGLLQYTLSTGVSGDYAIFVKGTLNVSGGTVTSDNWSNETVYSSGGTVNISGGTVQNTGGAGSLYLASNTVANISGGTVGGVYMGGNKLTVSGGAKIASIEWRSGTMDLTGAINVDGLQIEAKLTSLTVDADLLLPTNMELQVDTIPVTTLEAFYTGTVSHPHSGGTATCAAKAICKTCGKPYGKTDAHSFNEAGVCSGCEQPATITVTDGTVTYYALDADSLNQAVTTILEKGIRTFTVNLPATAENKLFTAIRRAICDTDGVDDGSIHLTLAGVTVIPEHDQMNPATAIFGDLGGEYVTQLASVNLPDVVTIGGYAFQYCEKLAVLVAPKVQTVGDRAFTGTNLSSVELPEATTLEYAAFYDCKNLTSIKLPKVTSLGQQALDTQEPASELTIYLTAGDEITVHNSLFYILNYKGNLSTKVNLVLGCAKANEVSGTTWTAKDASGAACSFAFKSITVTEHSYSGTDSGDGENHTATCDLCGTTVTEAHSGGEATCIAQAVCETCGASYGSLGDHNVVDGICDVCKLYGTCGIGATWTFDPDTGKLTISGTGAMTNYSGESAPWNSYASDITTVVIGSGVTSIGEYAFYYCTSLTSIEIPESVTSIGNSAFSACSSLTSIEIPSGVTSIGNNAFYSCTSLTSIDIPSGVTSIGNSAFGSCSSLTSIEIPESVTSIGNNALYRCTGLKTVSFAEGSQLKTIGSSAFGSCTALTSIEIPSGVTSIGDNAFYYCNRLTSVTMLGDAPTLRADVFYGCSRLNSIYVSGKYYDNYVAENSGWSAYKAKIVAPDSLVFAKVTGVEETYTWTGEPIQPSGITVKDYNGNTLTAGVHYTVSYGENTAVGDAAVTVTGMGDYMGSKTVGFRIVNPTGQCGDNAYWEFDPTTGKLTITGTGAMYDIENVGGSIVSPWGAYREQIVSIAVEAGITHIGNYSFSAHSNVTTVTLPNTLTSIGMNAFDNTAITKIQLPSGLKSIGAHAFRVTKLETVEIPDSVTEIGAFAFGNNEKLTGVTLPNNKDFTTISMHLFAYSTALREVTIPSSVTRIEPYAFQESGVTKVNMTGNAPKVYEAAFEGAAESLTVYVSGTTASGYEGGEWDTVNVIYVDQLTDSGVTLSTTEFSYNGQSQTPTVTVTNWADTVLTEGTDYTLTFSGDTTNVGEVTVTVTGIGNYGGKIERTYNILPVDAVLVESPAANTLTYNGKAQALVTAGSATGGTLYYSLDGESWSAEIPTATNAGTYTVYFYVKGDSNHIGTAVQATSVTIDKLNIANAVITPGESLTYNGNEQTQIIDSVKIGDLNVTSYTVSGNEATDAGEYELTVTGNGNYIGTVTLDWAIAKANGKAGVSISGWTYGETANAPKASSTTNDGAVTIQYKVKGAEDSTYTTDVPTNAGEYTVRATFAETDNYYAVTATANFIIGKAPVTFAISGNIVKKGDAISVVVTGDPAGITPTLTYQQGTALVTNPTNVGSYDIYAAFTDSNYRHASSTDGSAVKIGVLTIYEEEKPREYTLTFAGEGSENLTMVPAVADTIRIIPTPTSTPKDTTGNDKLFQGWSDGSAVYQAGEKFIQPEADVTLTAQWTDEVHKIDGDVTQSGTPIGEVQITLMRGSNEVERTVTNESGHYEFERCLQGIYNLVAEYNGIRKTSVVVLGHGDAHAGPIELPEFKTNSTVTVQPGTPDVVVGGLDKMMVTTDDDDTVYTPADQEIVEAGGEVEIEMEVKENPNPDSDTKAGIEAQAENISAGTTVGIYIDMDLTKTVTTTTGESTTTEIPVSNVWLENTIFLPGHLQGKAVYHVFREHRDGENVEITSLPQNSGDDGYFVVSADKTSITIYSKKYSTYAIGYTDEFTVSFDANGGTCGTVSMTTNASCKLDSLPTATRSGYVFAGWFTEAEGGTKVTENTEFTKNTNVYAQWMGIDAAVPAISTHPVSKQYCKGDTAQPLTVAASVTDGGALSYQWYQSATNSNEGGTAITGATGTSYTPSTEELGTVWYYCVVTSTNNSATGTVKTGSVTSDAAKIEVSHAHKWAADWQTNSTHHWHDCEAAGCPITENGDKNGYAAHAYGDWQNDSKKHWKACDCGVKTLEDDHDFGAWKVVKEATKTAKGEKQRTCSVCGHVDSKEIPVLSDTPATGDNSHMMLWVSLMIVSCAAILVLLNYKRFFSYGGKYSK